MGEVISIAVREIKAKGIDSSALPERAKIKRHLFSEDYSNLKLLDTISEVTLTTAQPVLFYPGCGCDVLFPMLYLEKIFSNIREIKMLYVDLHDNLPLIKTILDDVGVSFSENGSNITFYWGKLLVELEFMEKNVFEILPEVPHFDIYFEKAFRIMKERDPHYEPGVIAKLKPGGVLISDSGFQGIPFKKIEVPNKLSSYGEMIIGVKENNK